MLATIWCHISLSAGNSPEPNQQFPTTLPCSLSLQFWFPKLIPNTGLEIILRLAPVKFQLHLFCLDTPLCQTIPNNLLWHTCISINLNKIWFIRSVKDPDKVSGRPRIWPVKGYFWPDIMSIDWLLFQALPTSGCSLQRVAISDSG